MAELSQAELAESHERLLAAIRELEDLLAVSGDSSQPVELETPIGRLSRMDAMQQQQMALASREAQQRRLQLLRNALQAMARGDYGYCRVCEEPIGYQRLQARPETPFCLACQSRVEGGR